MFSKALFKQSCKANGMMWSIITFATCFMLACVMLISGNGNIGTVKNAIQDTIITKEIDSQLQNQAISYYEGANDGLSKFDLLFSENATDTLSYLVWLGNMPNQNDFSDSDAYMSATDTWKESMPPMKTSAGKSYALSISEWQNSMPSGEEFEHDADYLSALQAWQEQSPATQETAVKTAYTFACEELQAYVYESAAAQGYAKDSAEAQEILGSIMYALNPNGLFNDFYEENGEEIPSDYDILSLITHISAGDIKNYISSSDRTEYRLERSVDCSAIFIAGNMVKTENVTAMIEALASYGIDNEKYRSFGYTYDSIKHLSKTAIVTYQGRLEYEVDVLTKELANGELSEDEYQKAVTEKQRELQSAVSSSFLSTLPAAVSDALEEIGQMDLYTLVVGSVFYKLAGLLLPIIYMIMASNNLIAGQVDSGSMAYVLSTSTKRITVVFTQAVYLVGSLFCLFGLTTATGCVCLSLVSEEITLTYGNLILLNVGAFLVLFALSGLCFFTSCIFDRSKRSMAIGGGLSIFALVAAMLGLFGSPIIPYVIRLTSLNYFNYATVISLFDVISIMDGTDAFIWKFAILAVLGIIGYIIGTLRFIKKDLPL